MPFDYVIIGSGMFGCVFARQLAEAGRKVLIVDQRSHIGGNCYTERIAGINVHRYGPHSFHTDSEEIWRYVNRFAVFNNFSLHTKVNYRGRIFSFPINMMTMHQLWGVMTPSEAAEKLASVRIEGTKSDNLRDWAISQVGEEMYEIFIRGYTSKQWGRDPSFLPSFIIKRLPIRLTWDDRHHSDRYQGIPIGGYTRMFENMLDHPGIELQLNTNYFDNRYDLDRAGTKLIFSGKIDEFFDYRFGELEYRSLRFETKIMDGDYQGAAVINYTEQDVPYTRVIESKHFEYQVSDRTVVTWEYPDDYDKSKIPFYPIRDTRNSKVYDRYRAEADKLDSVIFGGAARLVPVLRHAPGRRSGSEPGEPGAPAAAPQPARDESGSAGNLNIGFPAT